MPPAAQRRTLWPTRWFLLDKHTTSWFISEFLVKSLLKCQINDKYVDDSQICDSCRGTKGEQREEDKGFSPGGGGVHWPQETIKSSLIDYCYWWISEAVTDLKEPPQNEPHPELMVLLGLRWLTDHRSLRVVVSSEGLNLVGCLKLLTH